MKPLKQPKKSLNNYARYSGIAFQMIAIILLGVFGGIKLDEWLELEFPVFTVVLAILSVILSMYYVTKDLIRTDPKNRKKGPQDS